jgi:hypothetical protein
MRRRKLISLVGLALVLALVSAACGERARTRAEQSPTPAAVANPDSGASTLRATLTAALQEHEYLAGIAIYAAVNTGLNSPVTKAATDALDANSVALSKAIGSIYGADAEKAFLPLWRKHIGFFVDYTVAKVKKDQAGQDKARADLDGYRSDFGAFLASANPNLTKEAVADALVPHVNSTFDAIDAVVAKQADAFAKLQDGAAKLLPVAKVLASAIAQQFPTKFDGRADSGAADLRATLTAALQEHEYLAGIAIFNAVNFGLTAPVTKAATDALDANSVALSKAIGSIYGADAEKAFLPLWRKHIGFFVDYTVAKVKKDQAGQDKARADLDGYRSDFGAFLASANPNLTKEAVADALVPHVNSTFDAIDAVVAKQPTQFSMLRDAAGKLPAIAAVLASAIVKQFPTKFA